VALRSPFQVDVVKDRGALARVVEDGTIENVYRLQIMNRTELPQTYRIGAQGIAGLEVQATEVGAPPAGIRSVVVSLRLPHDAAQPLRGQSVPVHFEVSLLDGTRTAPAVLLERSTFYIPR
jgi:polyferredoxin